MRALTLVVLGTCLVSLAAAASIERRDVEVLANGQIVEQNVTKSELIQTASGATWSIKLPSCPRDLNICCSFFQNWNWGSWDNCAKQVLNVGKALVKKAMEILDWITDARKLTKIFLSGPVGRKLWQLYDWGKKALKALVEAVENIVEGLVKVVMAIVRLVLALPKIPGCWTLDTNRRSWRGWSGALIPTDCGALSKLKKIDMWGFFKTLGGCFIRLSKIPHNSGIPLPTPFLNRHDINVCTYHIPPIIKQLVDGIVQIVKAIINLFFDVTLLFLELVDILVQDLIGGTPIYTLLKNAQKLVTTVKEAVMGKPPASDVAVFGPPTRRRRVPTRRRRYPTRRRRYPTRRRRYPTRRRRWSWRSAEGTEPEAQLREGEENEDEEEDEEEEVVAEMPNAFRAAIQRELERMEEASAASDVSTAEAVLEERDLSRQALGHMMATHQGEHPEMWQMWSNSNGTESEEAEDAGVVDRWATAVAADMDMESHLDTLMAFALAESTKAAAAFVFGVGASVKCNGEFTWKISLPWKLPLIVSTVSFALGMDIQVGMTLEAAATAKTPAYKSHPAVGLKLSATMSGSTSVDIGSPEIKMGPVVDKDPLRMCDNEKLTGFSVAPGYTGASCVAGGRVNLAGLGEGNGVYGWGFGFAMPLVIKAIAGILCAFVGGPVDKCMDKTPGDLINFAAGYADFSAKDKWYFKAGFNVLFTKYDSDKPFLFKRWTLLKLNFALSRTLSIFFGVPCMAKSSSSLAESVRGSLKEKLEATCDATASAKACASSDKSAEGVARCVQETLSAKLACGAGAQMEALHSEAPVVDTGLELQFNGRHQGGFSVRLSAGWVSGLSTLQAVASSPSLLQAQSGVRTTVSLKSKSDVQLRQVCLQWSSVEANNAFRDITGPAVSMKQRVRQMASALENKMQEESGKVESAESTHVADWVAFLRHMDEQEQEQEHGQEQVMRVSTSEAARQTDGDVTKCFKVRVGSVSAELDASLSGAAKAEGFQTSHAKLHSFQLASVSEQVEQEVLSSAPMQAAVDSLFASFTNAPVTQTSHAKQQMQAAIASHVAAGVQSTLGSQLCESLSTVVCPECEASASWSCL